MDKHDEIISILRDFQPKIKKSLNKTPFQDREDLEQEINTRIIEKLNSVEFKESPSFWSFLIPCETSHKKDSS